jgi:hypothetical protein
LNGSTAPLRSTHTSARTGSGAGPPVAYTSLPLAETATWAAPESSPLLAVLMACMTPSSRATGLPVSSSRATSKGAAINVPERTKTM